LGIEENLCESRRRKSESRGIKEGKIFSKKKPGQGIRRKRGPPLSRSGGEKTCGGKILVREKGPPGPRANESRRRIAREGGVLSRRKDGETEEKGGKGGRQAFPQRQGREWKPGGRVSHSRQVPIPQEEGGKLPPRGGTRKRPTSVLARKDHKNTRETAVETSQENPPKKEGRGKEEGVRPSSISGEDCRWTRIHGGNLVWLVRRGGGGP